MNMTARILTGLIAVLLGLPAALSFAQPVPNDQSPVYDKTGTGQTGPRFDDRRQRADDLLQRAGTLMDRGDLDGAKQLIGEAEALNPEYPLFYTGPTPRKLRRELEQRLQGSGRAPAPPGPLGIGGSRAGAPADPFAAGRRGDPAADPKTLAKYCVGQARQSLERGNLPEAVTWYHRAAEQRAWFGDHEDSPERLAVDLRRMGASLDAPMAGGPVPGNVTPLPRIDQATMLPPPTAHRPAGAPAGYGPTSLEPRGNQAQGSALLLQARRALADGDTRRASTLAEQARSLGCPFDDIDNPTKVQDLASRYSDLMRDRDQRNNTESWRRAYARILMEEANALLRYRDYDEAERLASDAEHQGVRFTQFEPRPELVLQHIDDLRRKERSPVRGPADAIAAEYTAPVGAGSDSDRRSANLPAIYNPSNDYTRNIPASNDQPMPLSAATGMAGQPSLGMNLFNEGQSALKAGDAETALRLFREAYAHVNELDPPTANRLHDYLQNLTPSLAPPRAAAPPEEAQARQREIYRQAFADVSMQESQARKLLEADPKGALHVLDLARARVEQSELDKKDKDNLLRRIDRAIADNKKFIAQHRPQIQLDEQNKAVRQQIQREQQAQQEIEAKFAQKVDEFRTCIHDQRYAEAELVAKQAEQLKPNDPVSTMLVEESKLMRHVAENRDVKERKEEGFMAALHSVDEAGIPFDDANPYTFPDAKTWKGLSDRRLRLAKEMGRRGGEREIEIRQKLKTPVALQFEQAPLIQVINYLGKIAGINIYCDPQGLAEEGITTDTPVTIGLQQEVKLEGAEPDPAPAALELRRQGRGAEDHQRVAQVRRPDRPHVQCGRPGDPHPQFPARLHGTRLRTRPGDATE